MTYFVIDKICSNACALYRAGDSFEKAVGLAGRISRIARRATYVANADQFKDIFFRDQTKEDINKYWKENSKEGAYGKCLYLPLPHDFKKRLK